MRGRWRYWEKAWRRREKSINKSVERKEKITVRSGSKKYTVTVTVPKVKTKKITGVPSKKTLRRKKSFTLKPKLTPRDSSYKITYRSSNKRVATVTSKGKVTAKARGTAIITVKSGSVSVRCKVTVK